MWLLNLTSRTHQEVANRFLRGIWCVKFSPLFCVGFTKNTLSRCESLRILPEFKEYEIIIIVGGNYNHAAYEIDKVANVTYIRAQQNSMNFTGLIALLQSV